MDRPLTRAEMVRWFERGFKAPSEHRVGLEWEKELVHADGRRVSFFGDHGIEDVLRRLTPFGWTGSFEGPHLIAMERDGATVTLEPGGQVEISTAPRRRVAEIELDVRRHLRELQSVLQGTDISPLAIGYTPIQAVEEIPFIPKHRYAIMRDYLARVGTMGHGMMKGTTSIQVTLDVINHADAAKKIEVGLGLAPLVTALFANSPLANGRDTGWASWRTHCWKHTDPARTGLLSAALSGGFTYERYIDWVLDVPMFFYRGADGVLRPAHGRSFREFASKGIDGRYASLEDFALQLNTVFPEVRVSRWLEMRGADNVPLALIPALVALWKGLLYDPGALDEAVELSRALPPWERPRLQELAASDGLAGRYKRRRLRTWATLMLEIAARGLAQQAPDGPAELAYLAPLFEILERGESPAISVWREFEKGPDGLMGRLAYRPVDEVPPVDPAAA